MCQTGSTIGALAYLICVLAVYKSVIPWANKITSSSQINTVDTDPPKLPELSVLHNLHKPSAPEKHPSLTLPVELIERIADFLFETKSQDDANSISFSLSKTSWENVAGFMNASWELHRMGLVRWVATLDIKHTDDWEMALNYTPWIKELRCLDGALDLPSHGRVLARFEHLYALSIDAHSDVTHNSRNQFAYRDLFRALPPSLRRLEITRAHGPDLKTISVIKECCPALEELRLGRCTVFNSASPCDFWRAFPFDHDSYMSSEETDSYARSLAHELEPLGSLQTLRLGLYLIPSTTVLAHRIYHRRGEQAPETIEWQQALPLVHPPAPIEVPVEPATTEQLVSLLHEHDPPTEFGPGTMCALCTEAIGEINGNAEVEANAILSELLPFLAKIQWMNWFSLAHLGVNSYNILRGD